MKTLDTLRILGKIGKILSTIIFICCIIGGSGCAVGMLAIPLADTGALKIGGVTLHSLVETQAGMPLIGLYPLLAGALIICTGEAITAKFAENYFAHAQQAGTPFTLAGAKEMLRLGILTICVPLGAMILSQIAGGIIAECIGCGEAFRPADSSSVALGVMFIIASLLCRHGAEIRDALPAREADCE